MQALSVVIITYNEEKNIARCITSVRQVADEVIVLDSYSDDKTVNIAVALGATVKQASFEGYIKQKNRAINLAVNDFVLLLDADEALSETLSASIRHAKMHFASKAYSMKRCNIFCGTHIKHGLWYPDKKLRLFDKRFGICGGLDPHDKIIMQDGITAELLKGDLLHYTYNSIEEYRKRNEEVSTVIAQSMFDAGIKHAGLKIIFSPLWAFINGYFLRLGFLNGYKGFVIAQQCAQQSFLKYSKLKQLYRQEITEMVWD